MCQQGKKKILKKRARNRSCNNQAITGPKISFMENVTPKSECGMAQRQIKKKANSKYNSRYNEHTNIILCNVSPRI